MTSPPLAVTLSFEACGIAQTKTPGLWASKSLSSLPEGKRKVLVLVALVSSLSVDPETRKSALLTLASPYRAMET